MAAGYAPTTRPRPAEPVRAVQARRGAGGDRGLDRRRPARPGEWQGHARDRPHGVAVRAARARLPAQDPRRGREARSPPASRSGSSATSGGPRPTPPTSPTRSSSCSPRMRSAASTTSSTAASRPAPTGPRRPRAGSASRSRSRRCPAATWARASAPPRWGVLAPTPAPRRRAHAAVDGGDGRLRARSRADPRGAAAPAAPR